MKRAVVVLSGGMDSAVCAAYAKSKGYELYLMHLNYGQLTEKREETAFNKLADFYKAKDKLILDTAIFKTIGGSSLIGDGDIPLNSTEKSINDRGAGELPSTYVPFRNGIIISLAVAWAEKLEAEKVFIGAIEADSSGYPDCREGFYGYMNKALQIGTKNGIEIETPLMELSKSDVVKLGVKLSVPFELTWSCYKNEDIPCGKCESCLLRAKGFKGAGIEDPLLKK